MNVYDSQRMADALAPVGFSPSDTPDNADMIILNTCHIREKAAEKVYSDIGRLRPHKQAKEDKGQSMVLAVAGCVAQAEGAEIMRRAPIVDMVFGPQTYHRLPEMVAKAMRKEGKVLDTDFPVESKFDHLPDEIAPQGAAAFIAVQEGCDKFCTFCVVPYTRGYEMSRPVAAILHETEVQVAAGAVEISFLGQNVNAFHGAGPDGKEWTLARLIHKAAEIPGLERIRFTTSHPRDMQDDLIEAFAVQPKLMPYFHLPIQAGSDKMLEAMNRKHTADHYRGIIDKIRKARSDVAISGDFIVGFPGETDTDFAETLRLVTDIDYASAYSFKYSPRPGTPAALSDLQIPEEVKAERLASLQQLLDAQRTAFNQATVGMRLPVLFERVGRQKGQLIGRSPFMQSVHAEADARLMGKIVDVDMLEAKVNSLAGQVVIQEWDGLSGHVPSGKGIGELDTRI